ncbi:MAG: YceD family protein [Calditrichota bacterium]
MKIRLAAYPPGVHRIIEQIDAADLALDPAVFSNPIYADLLLDRHDPYLQFTFDLQTAVRLECDRCLTGYDFALKVNSPMMYVLGRTSGNQDVDDPEIVYIPMGTTDLDISTDLRDFLILAVPEKKLCREDCRGICLRCGAELNVVSCSCGG